MTENLTPKQAECLEALQSKAAESRRRPGIGIEWMHEGGRFSRATMRALARKMPDRIEVKHEEQCYERREAFGRGNLHRSFWWSLSIRLRHPVRAEGGAACPKCEAIGDRHAPYCDRDEVDDGWFDDVPAAEGGAA